MRKKHRSGDRQGDTDQLLAGRNPQELNAKDGLLDKLNRPESGSRTTGLASSGAAARGAIFPSFLDRRARHIRIRAEHAAIALQRTEHRAAVPAVVEELTSISWHCLRGNPATLGAGQRRFQLHQAPPSARISGASIKLQQAEMTTTSVARERRLKVLPAGGSIQQVASRTHARRLRR